MTEVDFGRAMFRDHPDSVLFVTSQLRPRELKMAHAMRQFGWKVGLVYFRWTPFEPGKDFDFSISADSADEAHGIATRLAPRVCHVFSGAIDEWVLRLCRDKPCPVVIDLNDVFAPSLFDYCHERFEPTREAFALADGFCARDLQATRAEQNDGFALPPHRIFFPEYCWNDRAVPWKSVRELESPDVHVVSVGTFSLETEGMYDSCYLQLVRHFVDQEIHFHIYPHWSYRRDHTGSPHADFERDFADFLALEEASPFVHVHDSLSIEELGRLLPGYDYGIVSGGCAAFGQKLRFYKQSYLETCYSGRISDYVDARLPVLINDEVAFDFRLLRHYGIGVDLKGLLKPGFKATLQNLKRDPKSRIASDAAAVKLSVKHNAPRLARFYAQLAESGQAHRLPKREYMASKGPVPVARPPLLRESKDGVLVDIARRAATRMGVRRIAARIARVALPYRTIRLLEAVVRSETAANVELRKNNVLMRFDCDRFEAERDDLLARIQLLEDERSQPALTEQVKILEADVSRLSRENHVLSNEKLLLLQETRWGRVPIAELAGVLNWPNVLDDVQRNNGFNELLRIVGLFASSTHPIDGVSSCWDVLAVKNFDQLLSAGYDNFKRTIGLNYFNFLVQATDPQLRALETLLTPEVVARCRQAADDIADDPMFDWHNQRDYRYFVLLLWAYAKTIDVRGCLSKLAEPDDGNPLCVPAENERASQDLANALIEYYSMSEAVSFDRTGTVLEIGGGYGRNAHLMLALNPGIRVVLVDIPPALFIAQRYLSSTFEDRRVFRVREFDRYEDVRQELGDASIAFLMPHQLALLPERYFDLSLNISSFGEMTGDQIGWYFEQMGRLTREHIYVKQWKISTNVFDGTVIAEADYPYPSNWRQVYSRQCRVQTDFFEALYRVEDRT